MYRTRKATIKYNPRRTRKQLKTGNKPCPFCDLPEKQIISKNKSMLIVRNLYPYQFWDFMKVIDHLMIVPIRHVESMHEFNSNEQAELVKLMAEFQNKGYNIYARERGNSIKSVPHQHTHLIKCDSKVARFYLYLHRPYILFRF